MRDQLRKLDLVVRLVEQCVRQGVDVVRPDHDRFDRGGFEFIPARDLRSEITNTLGGGSEIFLLEIMRQDGADPGAQQRQDGPEDVLGSSGIRVLEQDHAGEDKNPHEGEDDYHVGEDIGKISKQFLDTTMTTRAMTKIPEHQKGS